MRSEPCVIERKNRIIFENKITFDISPLGLNTPKYRYELKTYFNKFESDYIVLHYFITKKLYLTI